MRARGLAIRFLDWYEFPWRHRLSYCLAYLGAIGGVGFSLFHAGWGKGWALFGIVAMEPQFADFRSIQGALVSESLGLNPQVSNPGDPWGRLLNYPYLWVDLARVLNIGDESNFMSLCSLIVLSFVLCCFDLLRRYPSLPMLMALISSAPLLGVERCNNDLVIFVILYVASFLYAKNWFFIPVAVAGFLKIFPLFALCVPFAIGRRRAFFLTLLPTLGAIFLFHDEIFALKKITPGSVGMSYGISSVSKLIGSNPLSYIVLLFSSAFMIALVFRSAGNVKKFLEKFSGHSFGLFVIGSSIYVGTYILASNWDYRLIFLIFCIPFLSSVNFRLFRVLIFFSLIAMNFQLFHASKTRMAIVIVNWLDLTDMRWLELFRIPWFVADHTAKAILFCVYFGVLLRSLFFPCKNFSADKSGLAA